MGSTIQNGDGATFVIPAQAGSQAIVLGVMDPGFRRDDIPGERG